MIVVVVGDRGVDRDLFDDLAADAHAGALAHSRARAVLLEAITLNRDLRDSIVAQGVQAQPKAPLFVKMLSRMLILLTG
jgi:hypothetical protein